jgi:hypothetical protein
VAVSVTIEPRFNGPPESGHGGYSCGLLGASFEAPMAVSLRVPPPLSRPLTVDGDRLLDGDTLVAAATPAEVAPALPPMPATAPPAPDDPVYGELHEHPFPTCFACGPDRAPGDGLRIFAARIAGGDGMVAAPWTPDPNLAGADGNVEPIFVWAALDCPTGHACAIETPAVLARLALRRLAPVRAGEPHVVAAWPLHRDGRKHHAAGCLYDAAGTPLAVSVSLWIELRHPGALGARV